MLVGIQTAYAQTSFFVKAGPTLSSFKSGIEYDPLIGYQVGAGLAKVVTSRFSIQTKVVISTKGGTSKS